MELKDIIKDYRDENNLTQREFAAKCKDISHAYIAVIEKDISPATGKPPRPSMEKLTSIAHGMGMELDELLEKMNGKKTVTLHAGLTPPTLDPRLSSVLEDMINERVNDRMRQNTISGLETTPYTLPRAQVPIIGTVRCGPGGLALEDIQGYEGADVSNADDYFYLRAVGDSMEPQIFDGDLVLVHIQPDVDNGALAIVIIDGEEGTLKKYIKKENAVVLQAFNPAYHPRVLVGEEMQKIRIAGKVVQSIRKW